MGVKNTKKKRNKLWKEEMNKKMPGIEYTKTHPIQGGRRRRTRKKKGGTNMCVICLTKLPNTTTKSIIKLKCGHRFHFACIDQLIRSGYPVQCPLCRKHIHLDDLIKSAINSNVETRNNLNQMKKSQMKDKLFRQYDALKNRFTFLSKIKNDGGPQNEIITHEVSARLIEPVFASVWNNENITKASLYHDLISLAFHMLYIQEAITLDDNDPNKDLYEAMIKDIQKGIDNDHITPYGLRWMADSFPGAFTFKNGTFEGGKRRRRTRKKKGGRKDKKKDKKLHEKEKTTIQYRELARQEAIRERNRFRRLEQEYKEELEKTLKEKIKKFTDLDSSSITLNVVKEEEEALEHAKKEYFRLMQIDGLRRTPLQDHQYNMARLRYHYYHQIQHECLKILSHKLKERKEKMKSEDNNNNNNKDDETKEGGRRRKKSRRKKRRRKKRTRRR